MVISAPQKDFCLPSWHSHAKQPPCVNTGYVDRGGWLASCVIWRWGLVTLAVNPFCWHVRFDLRYSATITPIPRKCCSTDCNVMPSCIQYSSPALIQAQKHIPQVWTHLFKMVSSFFYNLIILILFCKKTYYIACTYHEGDMHNFYADYAFKKNVSDKIFLWHFFIVTGFSLV